MADFVESLVEMGFPRDKASKAVEVTGNRGVEPAMEWILQNPESDQPGTSKAASETPSETGVSNESKSGDSTEEKADAADVRSYKCEDCGKLFKDVEAVEFHAAKTNHSNFSESTEEKKPLTPEEKAEQMRLLEERLKQKRKEREEREKREDLEREKSRVAMGKELAEAKRRLAEQEMKEIAEARRREKIDDKMARERVKAQIEQDKLARKAKFGQQDGTVEPPPPPKPVAVAEPATAVSPPKKDYKETKLQLRLPNGKTLVQTFGVSEPLAAVRLYIELNRDDGGQGTFNLMTSFPRKVYQGDEYDMPLEALGLVPTAVLMVTKSA
ncbi:UBX domain-containing protein 1-A [Orchesella cincta]|uniref:UBX domain-containing protein 1-A n=1 Tax=Orchesella cincta TaxID=48709 RepID=A0A1D2MJI9_ORCCI|nr:UBX domain-containing protein 1-A [Orchesella cincta]